VPSTTVAIPPFDAAATAAIFSATLEKHNTYRAKHQVSPLVWSNEVSQGAYIWAAGCKWGHDPNCNQGENIYGSGYFTPAAAPLSNAVDMWYNEINNYDYTKDYQSGTGHATQVLWKSSTTLGCAYFACGSTFTIANGIFLVCRYTPAGNMIGAFTANVLPPIGYAASLSTTTAAASPNVNSVKKKISVVTNMRGCTPQVSYEGDFNILF
jgi:uncharacterized protein YkwD